MSEYALYDIQNATESAFQEYKTREPELMLDRDSLYDSVRMTNLLKAIDDIVGFCFRACTDVEPSAMFANYANRLKDFKGNDVMAWRIVSAFSREVLHKGNPRGLSEKNWRAEYKARGGRPYIVVSPTPKVETPKVETPEKDTPKVEHPAGYFDVDAFLEFYDDDEPEPVKVEGGPVEVETPKGPELQGFTLEELLTAMGKSFESWAVTLARKAIRGQLIYLWGPPGVGKSFFPMDLARVLDIPIIIIQAVSMPEVLIGCLDINGEVQRTKFNQAIQKPCIVIFEEVDSWNGKTREALMPFFANGAITFDDGTTIHRHPKCLIFGTGNTNMAGPTKEHPNRERIDQAFADRWRFHHVTYSRATARRILKSKYPDLEEVNDLLDFGDDYEHARAQVGAGIPWAYRPMERIADDLVHDDGESLEDILRDNLTKGMLSKDTLIRIADLMTSSNRFSDAFKRLKR